MSSMMIVLQSSDLLIAHQSQTKSHNRWGFALFKRVLKPWIFDSDETDEKNWTDPHGGLPSNIDDLLQQGP